MINITHPVKWIMRSALETLSGHFRNFRHEPLIVKIISSNKCLQVVINGKKYKGE